MARFVLTNRRAGKFHGDEKRRSRAAAVRAFGLLEGSVDLLAASRPDDELAREVVVFEAGPEEVAARAVAVGPDVIVEPEILHYPAVPTAVPLDLARTHPDTAAGEPMAGTGVTLTLTVVADDGPALGAQVLLYLRGTLGLENVLTRVTGEDGRAPFEFGPTWSPAAALVLPAGDHWTRLVRGPTDGAEILLAPPAPPRPAVVVALGHGAVRAAGGPRPGRHHGGGRHRVRPAPAPRARRAHRRVPRRHPPRHRVGHRRRRRPRHPRGRHHRRPAARGVGPARGGGPRRRPPRRPGVPRAEQWRQPGGHRPGRGPPVARPRRRPRQPQPRRPRGLPDRARRHHRRRRAGHAVRVRRRQQQRAGGVPGRVPRVGRRVRARPRRVGRPRVAVGHALPGPRRPLRRQAALPRQLLLLRTGDRRGRPRRGRRRHRPRPLRAAPHAAFDGTSMASPVACGILAAVLSVRPEYLAADRSLARTNLARDLLREAARTIGLGADAQGMGLVSAQCLVDRPA